MEEFRKEWVGVDLYDIAERGALYRSLSRSVSDNPVQRRGVDGLGCRPFSILTRSMRYWMSLSEEAKREDLGSVVVRRQYVSSGGNDQVLALLRVRTDMSVWERV